MTSLPIPELIQRIRRSWQTRREIRLITSSGLFDRDWYLDQYPDVHKSGMDAALHYLHHGAAEGRNPGPWFEMYRQVTRGAYCHDAPQDFSAHGDL